MAIKVNPRLSPALLVQGAEFLFKLSGEKILELEKSWDPARGTPVFTQGGKYTSRGWTEWTQGFQYGSALLQFDAVGDRRFLELGRKGTVEKMASHVSHLGVHDHGFNNISTYGNLWRLMREKKIPFEESEKNFLELALKISGAVQAARWTETAYGHGFIYSFNGPHSLFIDTIRSLRSLAVAHQLGHVLMSERDRVISLLGRLIEHLQSSIRFNIYFGEGRDAYDVAGRTAHESIFNTNDGHYRCPSSQQGYSPFTTWTRGLAWAICGLAEQLEFLSPLPEASFNSFQSNDKGTSAQKKTPARFSKKELLKTVNQAALATADFYMANCCHDGIPLWDTGAPLVSRLKNYQDKPSDPYNLHEPVDSSAAAIAAQGFLRLGNFFSGSQPKLAVRYRQAGLTMAQTLFSEPYLSTDPRHQGLILHSVYHRPNGWDHVRRGQKIPNGESSMWGDYHARELALMILREARHEPSLLFFDPKADSRGAANK